MGVKLSFASYLKVGYEIWWAWITVECWIKFVNHNFRIERVWLLKYWVLLNLIGIFMCTASLWEVTKDDLKNVSVYAGVYYATRLFVLVDSRTYAMNEADDDRNVVISYRLVIADLIQLLQ